MGEPSVADAARPAGPDNLWIVPANRDLAGASIELPRIDGYERRLRETLGPVRERFALTLLDCPPSLGPVTVNALVAADRVIVPVQAEYLALEGLVQFLETLDLVRRELNPGAGSDRRRDHHARRAHPARAGRRARAPQTLLRTGVRHRDPAKRPRRRGPEPRRSRSSSTRRRRQGSVAYRELAAELAERERADLVSVERRPVDESQVEVEG